MTSGALRRPPSEARPSLSMPVPASQNQFARYIKRFRIQKLGLLGLSIIAFFALLVILHPILRETVWGHIRYDPVTGFDQAIAPHPTPPSATHWLGTDGFGRDVLSQLMYGARISFVVGIVAAVIAVTLSTTAGGLAGYFGGWVDMVVMGIADVFVLMPAPVVLLIVGLALRMNSIQVAVAYGVLVGLGVQAIVVKSQALSIKAKPFVEAARISGGSDWHVLKLHILPGLVPLMLVHAVYTVVGAVLVEALLSFFGRTWVDVSWGTMIWLGQETFRWFTIDGQWHAIIAPALAIMLFCSAFYLVGRSLDEVVNPRLRRP